MSKGLSTNISTMAQAQINMRMSAEEVQIEKNPVLQTGGGKKTILKQRRKQKFANKNKQNMMKQHSKIDPKQLANIKSPTSKEKKAWACLYRCQYCLE